MNKYLSKPVQVEAYRLTSENIEELSAWCNGRWEKSNPMVGSREHILMITSNGYKKVNIGDWIVKDVFPLDNTNFVIKTNSEFLQQYDKL